MSNKPLTEKEKRAWEFAINAHGEQKRAFSGASYFDAHVEKVNGILRHYTTDEDMLCAAILHDVIEDCFNDKEEGYRVISENFGERVANLVIELTSDTDEIRRLGKSIYLANKMINMSNDALVIKLCDRLQNISDLFTASAKFRNRYTRETVKIIKLLEQKRTLNRIHLQIIDNIKAKLKNIKIFFKNLNENKMKHLKSFKIFESRLSNEEIHAICAKFKIKNTS